MQTRLVLFIAGRGCVSVFGKNGSNCLLANSVKSSENHAHSSWRTTVACLCTVFWFSLILHQSSIWVFWLIRQVFYCMTCLGCTWSSCKPLLMAMFVIFSCPVSGPIPSPCACQTMELRLSQCDQMQHATLAHDSRKTEHTTDIIRAWGRKITSAWAGI